MSVVLSHLVCSAILPQPQETNMGIMGSALRSLDHMIGVPIESEADWSPWEGWGWCSWIQARAPGCLFIGRVVKIPLAREILTQGT